MPKFLHLPRNRHVCLSLMCLVMCGVLCRGLCNGRFISLIKQVIVEDTGPGCQGPGKEWWRNVLPSQGLHQSQIDEAPETQWEDEMFPPPFLYHLCLMFWNKFFSSSEPGCQERSTQRSIKGSWSQSVCATGLYSGQNINKQTQYKFLPMTIP